MQSYVRRKTIVETADSWVAEGVLRDTASSEAIKLKLSFDSFSTYRFCARETVASRQQMLPCGPTHVIFWKIGSDTPAVLSTYKAFSVV